MNLSPDFSVFVSNSEKNLNLLLYEHQSEISDTHVLQMLKCLCPCSVSQHFFFFFISELCTLTVHLIIAHPEGVEGAYRVSGPMLEPGTPT